MANETAFIFKAKKKSPDKDSSFCKKGGGFLLSRIALQYHRRRQA